MSFDTELLQRYTNWFNRPDSYTKHQSSGKQSGEQNEKRDRGHQRWCPSPAEIIQSIEKRGRDSSSNGEYDNDSESDSSTDSSMFRPECLRVKKSSGSCDSARPKKKTPAKSRKNGCSVVKRAPKRRTPQVSESNSRASKVQKTERTDITANFAKRGGKEAANAKKQANSSVSDPSEDIISLLSSEEERIDHGDRTTPTSLHNQPHFDFDLVSIKTKASTSSLLDNADAVVSTTTVEEERRPNIHSEESERSDSSSLRTELEKCRMALDAQTVRAEKAEAEVAKLEQWRDVFHEQVHNEKQVAENEKRQMQETTNQQIAELESAHCNKVSQLTENNEKLATELEKANMERDQLLLKHEEICNQNLAMKTEQEDLCRELESEKKKSQIAAALEAENAMLLDELDTAKKTDLPNLQAENACLRGELEEMQRKHASTRQQLDTTCNQLHREIAAPKTLPPDSPTPSDLEQRSENVRRAFLKAKRQYDSLFSITRNITALTRGMTLGNFGEFGKHLRQLRTAVEEGERNEEGKEIGAPKEVTSDESGVVS